MNAFLLIDDRDNVAIALQDLSVEQVLSVKGHAVVCKDRIPNGHKLAIQPIPSGAPIIKYGEDIGQAACDIEVGEHVHTHNVIDTTADKELRERARLLK